MNDTTNPGRRCGGPLRPVWIGVALTWLGLAIFVAADAYFAHRDHEFQIHAQRSQELQDFLKEEDKRLNTVHYTTDRKDVVSIPMDPPEGSRMPGALELYLQEHGGKH